MKKIIFSLIAIMAIVAVSCQKEDSKQTQNDEQSVATRVVTGYFESMTKTSIGDDGLTPKWEKDDVIRLYDGNEYEDITLTQDMISSDNRFSFKTKLTGETLYAIYPASALLTASFGGLLFKVPEIQDGTFKGAHICVAKGDDNNNLCFKNATAIVKFTQDAAKTGVKKIYAGRYGHAGTLFSMGCQVSFNDDGSIMVGQTGGIFGCMVESDTAQDVYYMALPPGTNSGPSGKELYQYKMCKDITQATTKRVNDAICINKMYDFGSMDNYYFSPETGTVNGHDYVQIGQTKWATQNLSVTESGARMWKGKRTDGTNTGVCVGDYFQWAAYKGYRITDNYVIYSSFTHSYVENSYYSPSDGVVGKLNPFPGCEISSISQGPYYGIVLVSPKGALYGYTKYGPDEDLEESDDVAAMEWGSGWHIPTGRTDGEFDKLRQQTCWQWDSADNGYYVFEPLPGDAGKVYSSGKKYDKANALLFFPACGFPIGEDVKEVYTFGQDDVEARGIYMTSSAASVETYYGVTIGNGGVIVESCHRSFFCFIRPCI